MPVHENLRTHIQRQAGPEASQAGWKGARGGKRRAAVRRSRASECELVAPTIY